MQFPEDPEELELVRKAISLIKVVGCLEWNPKQLERVRSQPPLPGFELDPEGVKQLLFEFMENAGEIVQVKEVREGWRDQRAYWYKAVIPLEGLPRGLFVEFYLQNDDADYPVVHLVNYHD